MHFSIDPRSPASPSEQLADQVRFAVASGRLVAGDRLPPVRAMASVVRVNPNTVSRAWRELELAGVLVARRGDGMFVADGARSVCRVACEAIVEERVTRAVREGLEAGLTPEDVLNTVRAALAAPRRDLEAS